MVRLPGFPYYSQLDNEQNPTGACNVTSVAMVLDYFGAKRNPRYGRFEQFEDELYSFMRDYGLSRHQPYDLAKVVRYYGCFDHFTEKADIEQVKKWLDSGNPVIIHGYFTAFGHIMPAIDYDDTGLIVNDPYGEWFSDGYRTDLSGERLRYSYNLIERTCYPDGFFWVHFCSKEKITITEIGGTVP